MLCWKLILHLEHIGQCLAYMSSTGPSLPAPTPNKHPPVPISFCLFVFFSLLQHSTNPLFSYLPCICRYGGYSGIHPAKKSTDPDNDPSEMSLSELMKREQAAEEKEDARYIPPVFSKEAQRRIELKAQRKKAAKAAAAGKDGSPDTSDSEEGAAAAAAAAAAGGEDEEAGASSSSPSNPWDSAADTTPAVAGAGRLRGSDFVTAEEVAAAAAANRERIRARREYVQRGVIIPPPSPPGQMGGHVQGKD